MSKPRRPQQTNDANVTDRDVRRALSRIDQLKVRLSGWALDLDICLYGTPPQGSDRHAIEREIALRGTDKQALAREIVGHVDWLWKNQSDRSKGPLATDVGDAIRVLNFLSLFREHRAKNPFKPSWRQPKEMDLGDLGIAVVRFDFENLACIQPEEWKRAALAWRGLWTTPRGTLKPRRYNAYSVLFSLLSPHGLAGRSKTARSFQRSCEAAGIKANAPPQASANDNAEGNAK